MSKTNITLDINQAVLSVDPGDIHVGMAMWEFDKEVEKWRCVHAQEMTRVEFLEFLELGLSSGTIGCVVYEIWQLYGDKALEQTGSEFEAVQLIGVIKYLVERMRVLWPDPGPCQIFKQPAGIKTPTINILRKLKVTSMAKSGKMDPDGHGFDAELHGYNFFGKNNLPLHFNK